MGFETPLVHDKLVIIKKDREKLGSPSVFFLLE